MNKTNVQKIIGVVMWLAVTIYLFAKFTLKDVIFFWVIWEIWQKIQEIGYQVESTHIIQRYMFRVLLATSGIKPIKAIEGAVKVFDWDSNVMTVEEMNKHYLRLGEITGARVWYEDGFINKLSARNIAAYLLGMGIDPVVEKFVNGSKKSAAH